MVSAPSPTFGRAVTRCPLSDASPPSQVRLVLAALALSAVAAEQVFEDSPALSTLWQASSSGQTEMFISQLIQNREYGSHRSSDGRGPMFWAYEFKNVDTLALLMHLGVSASQVTTPSRVRARVPSGPSARLAERARVRFRRRMSTARPRSSSSPTATTRAPVRPPRGRGWGRVAAG